MLSVLNAAESEGEIVAFNNLIKTKTCRIWTKPFIIQAINLRLSFVAFSLCHDLFHYRHAGVCQGCFALYMVPTTYN